MSIVHTAFICDNNYSIQTAVALVSMRENMFDTSIYYNNILCSNVDKNNIEKLRSIATDNFIINIINVDIKKYDNISDDDKTYLAFG